MCICIMHVSAWQCGNSRQPIIMLRAGGAKLPNLTLHVSTTLVLPMCSVCTVKVSSGPFQHNLALKGLRCFVSQ